MDFRRRAIGLLVASLAVISLAAAANAGVPTGRSKRPGRHARPANVQTTVIDRKIDVNNINMFVTNVGSFAFNMAAQDAGLFYPKGTQKSAVFASGLWLGATVGTEVRTVMAEYSSEYGPGAMVGTTFDDPTKPEYTTYKVARFTGARNDQGQFVDTMHVTRVADETVFEDPLVHHSWSEYMAGAAPHGAPWKYYRLEDTATPAPGDSIDVPGPDVAGDQMIWAVYNDADPGNHTNQSGGSSPLGVEIQQTTFAFNSQGALGNTIFLKYIIINKGGQTLDNLYVSQWSDPDLGGAAGFTDDLVGCDTLPDGTGKPRSLGYVYNSTNNDGGYGATPPALGYDFFQGPNVGTPSVPNYLPMTSFNKYINGTDPSSPDEIYNYMQGLAADGSDAVDPFGVTTKYLVAGDPVSPTPGVSWLDDNPADRRMMLSSGPFTMLPGDTQIVVCAIVVGQGSNRLSSISALRYNDEFAQAAFDSLFRIPRPPPAPVVKVSTDHQQVTLSWDASSRTDYDEPGYAFEGYNVYQGASRSGPWKLLSTFDEVNGTRVIYDRVFDIETGQFIPQFPVAFGSDAGVASKTVLTQDAVRGGSLHDGTEYYFAVTSYSYNAGGLPKVLENAQDVIRVTPQRPPSGTDLTTASVTPVAYLRKDTTKDPSTDVVSVEVLNPELVTGHTYKVVFDPLAVPYSGPIGQLPSVNIFSSWALVDSTTGVTKFSGQLNRNGDDDYRVVDGIRVKVTGKYEPAVQSGAYLNLNEANARGLTGINFGMSTFSGGAGYPGGIVLGQSSSIDPVADPDSFVTVEIRFSRTATQKAYRYFRLQKDSDGGAPPQGRAWNYGGFFDVPWQLWDTVHNRQLDGAFVERMLTADDGTYLPLAQQPVTQDSTWGPTNSIVDDSGEGGREYLVVFNRPYSSTPKATMTVDGLLPSGTMPLMYELIAAQREFDDGSLGVIDDGDAFKFTWANPAKSNDIYVFSTETLQQNNASLAKSKLDRIRAVPNPYYAHSVYEINQFARKIRFVNMPEQCTVRIFNLAGQLVRTLEKTDATSSVLEWDVQTQNSLPVGSGIYIFHVQAKGVGEYTGRLVVFMEKERLNSF